MQLVPPSGPTRLLALATFVNTFGNGLFYAGSVLFFTRSVGLSPGQVGFGLTFVGAVGLLSGVPFGHLGDRRGAREILVAGGGDLDRDRARRRQLGGPRGAFRGVRGGDAPGRFLSRAQPPPGAHGRMTP